MPVSVDNYHVLKINIKDGPGLGVIKNGEVTFVMKSDHRPAGSAVSGRRWAMQRAARATFFSPSLNMSGSIRLTIQLGLLTIQLGLYSLDY